MNNDFLSECAAAIKAVRQSDRYEYVESNEAHEEMASAVLAIAIERCAPVIKAARELTAARHDQELPRGHLWLFHDALECALFNYDQALAPTEQKKETEC